MLKRLKIKGFQCHEQLVVDFDEHITTLVGRSDVGKSAVIRALRWLCLNKPSGAAFLRHGSKAVSVVLRAEDFTVVRSRSQRQGNLYRLDRDTFRNLGAAGVPEGIAGVLNVGPENFAGQHDPPYWLSDSPGQVAKELNRIVSLDLIDSTLGNLAASLRKAKTVVEVTQDRLAEAEQQQAELAWVTDANEQLCSIEQLEQDIEEKRSRIAKIDAILAEVREVEEGRRNAAAGVLAALEAISVGERIVAGREQLRCLQEMLDRITAAETDVQVARRAVRESAADLERMARGRCPTCGNVLKTL